MTYNPSPRARDLPIPGGYWRLPTGPHNAISDVPGVRVGHTTLISGHGPLRPGAGPIRTGVTVILPHTENLFRHKLTAAAHVINGFGKACGLLQVCELGQLETPIALTSTLSVWRAAEALAQWSIARNPDIGISTTTVNPIALECNDGYLNDVQGSHLQHEHVWQALEEAATGPVSEGLVSEGNVSEGNVGGGTGMSCFGWKGGIGTSSRVIQLGATSATGAAGYTLGALVQANFGRPGQLIFTGCPVGQRLTRPRARRQAPQPPGSVVIVLATDAPLDNRQMQRLCSRATAGLARTGSTIDHGSGDFVVAFSTTRRIPHEPAGQLAQTPHSAATGQTAFEAPLAATIEGQLMDAFFLAVAEAVEESVLNALCAADTMEGRDGHINHALPLDQVARLFSPST